VPPLSRLNTTAEQETLFSSIAADLRAQGYAITHNALPADIARGLQERILTLQESGLRHAGTGRQQEHQVNGSIRRDKIRWLTREDDSEAAWLRYMDSMQQYMNRHLFLGLFSYECHFSHYQPGDFYKKHLDAFRGQANRLLTTVLYLNPDWQPADEGELVIYQADTHDDELLRVRPDAGTLVTFLSEEYPHEVLPARRDRYSIAGWFRLNSSTGGRADPPR